MSDTPEKMADASAEPVSEATAPGKAADEQRVFTRWERAQIFVASWVGYLAVALVGPTLHWETVGWENYEAAYKMGKSLIFAFWHSEIFPATWFWRKRGIVVMASRNFDGEYISRIIQMHGYGVARGSSSRGASRALVEMIRAVRKGREAAFTLDGPRGPRHVAKPGVVALAKATGAPILCFHIAPRHAWVLRKSWDQTEIPQPFAQTAVFIAPPILVDSEADENEQARKLHQVQIALDGLVKQGDAWLGRRESREQNSESKT